jgi:hypothetical protein
MHFGSIFKIKVPQYEYKKPMDYIIHFSNLGPYSCKDFLDKYAFHSILWLQHINLFTLADPEGGGPLCQKICQNKL